jgi:hypothetical protein
MKRTICGLRAPAPFNEHQPDHASSRAFVLLALGCFSCLVGCGGSPTLSDWSGLRDGTTAADDVSRARVTADWNDLDAAVHVASSQAEMALLTSGKPEPTDIQGRPSWQRRFELVTIEDWPATVIARVGGSPEPGPLPIDLEVRVGPLAHAQAEARGSSYHRSALGRERLLLRAITQRLEDLRGREWAPLRPIDR